MVLALSLAVTIAAAAYIVRTGDAPRLQVPIVLGVGLALGFLLFAITRIAFRTTAEAKAERDSAHAALARHAERLKILHGIDGAIVAGEPPEEIAGAAIVPLREILGASRAVVNLFDLATGEVEWLAAAGRKRVHIGGGVRFSIRLMGDIEGLRGGVPQKVDTRALPAGPEVDALLASGVEEYMVVPMMSGGELIGALSFGGAKGSAFPLEQMRIAEEVATQLAIVITQARLHDRVKRHADELERRVEERTEQLLVVNRELEAFSYSVSHDLRAPLRGIDDSIGQLAADHAAISDPQSRKHVERIRSSARRMGELTEDLLQLAAAGRGELRREAVDLSRLAREIIENLRDRDSERNVLAEVEDHLLAQADRRLVRIVLENLLGNAWKFTSKTREARIAFGSEARDGSRAYFVRDNGAGFDMAYAGKLFQPFHRLHGETEFTGTGIGLATVHRVVARHEGRVWAESAVDRGATFFFTLGPGEAL